MDAHIPSIIHVVACVSGTGSQFLRYATFAIVNNIFHSFGTNSEYKLNGNIRFCVEQLALTSKVFASDAGHGSLSLFLRQLSSSESMRLFRVTECDNGQAVVNAAMHMVDRADGRYFPFFGF